MAKFIELSGVLFNVDHILTVEKADNLMMGGGEDDDDEASPVSGCIVRMANGDERPVDESLEQIKKLL